MDVIKFLIEFLNSIQPIVAVAIIALLVSCLSAYYSSKALRINLRAEKRINKLEMETKILNNLEKKTEITRLLNGALMDLYQAKISLELSKQHLIWLINFFKSPISGEFKKTEEAVDGIETKRSNFELSVRDLYTKVQEESELLELEKYLTRSDAMKKAATMERERAESIHHDLLKAKEVIHKS